MNRLCIYRIVGLITLTQILSACVMAPAPRPGDPHYAPTISTTPTTPVRTAGSLYQVSYGLSLFSDTTARNVGDIITIMLSERTVSQKTSGVNIKKDSSLSLPVGSILGVTSTHNGIPLDTSISQARDFSGDSGANQSNSLNGSIAVTVAEVLPNGNLVVRGEKWITLNRGDEFIRISGILRPEDVSPENKASSTQLANAKISYSETGALAEAQSIGWLSRFFNSVYWPF